MFKSPVNVPVYRAFCLGALARDITFTLWEIDYSYPLEMSLRKYSRISFSISFRVFISHPYLFFLCLLLAILYTDLLFFLRWRGSWLPVWYLQAISSGP